MTYEQNIQRVLDMATLGELVEGDQWYNEAYILARELSPNDVWRGAGVIAAFSPMCPWNRNVKLARQAFATGVATGHTKATCATVNRILSGEHPLDVMGGDKTRSFCEAIATNGRGSIATIDRHAHDIAMGRPMTDDERKIGKRVYREMSDAYSEVARTNGLTVNSAQAITWVVWRRRKGIE